MKLMLLGTAAAEGWPALFCQCDACREAEKRGGREIRTRSGALVDDILMIDLNPDLLHQKLTHHLDLGSVRDIIVTHNHSDHFQPGALSLLRPVMAHRRDGGRVRVFGSEAVMEEIGSFRDVIEAHVITSGQTFQTERHQVTALPAVHGAPSAHFFLVERCGQAILYAHDTDLFSGEAWDILTSHVKKPLSIVSCDCTNGPLKGPRYRGHMGFDENAAIRSALLARGMAGPDTRFLCSHFSHNGGVLYKEAVERMRPEGFEIGYDGMVVQVDEEKKA